MQNNAKIQSTEQQFSLAENYQAIGILTRWQHNHIL